MTELSDFYDRLNQLYESGDLAAIDALIDGVSAEDSEKLISGTLDSKDTLQGPSVHNAAEFTTKAAVLCRRGDYTAALECFRQALEVIKRLFGENIEYAMCRRGVAEIYELLGDTRSASEIYSDAARVLSKLLGPDHPTVIETRKRGKLL